MDKNNNLPEFGLAWDYNDEMKLEDTCFHLKLAGENPKEIARRYAEIMAVKHNLEKVNHFYVYVKCPNGDIKKFQADAVAEIKCFVEEVK